MGKDFEYYVDLAKEKIISLLQKTPIGKRAITHALESRFNSKIINSALNELIKNKEISLNPTSGAYSLSNQKTSGFQIGDKAWCKLQISNKRGELAGQSIVCYAVPEQAKGRDIKVVSQPLVCKQDYLLSGDRACIKVTGFNEKGKPVGVVTDLDKTKRPRFVHGIVCATSSGEKYLKVVGASSRLNFDVSLSGENAKNAPVGELVKAQISSYPTTDSPYLIANLAFEFGDSSNPQSFENCFISNYELSTVFPEDVLAEASAIKDPNKEEVKNLVENEGFVDLRELPTTTTDPDSAKDFDDASSVVVFTDEKGKKIYELYQHIANVGHYSHPGTKLFQEAQTRGTSTYLAKTTIPMYPQTLSNGVCSLKPDVDRLALTTVMLFDEKGNPLSKAVEANGKVHRTCMFQSVIHSDRRMTYSENQRVIDGEDIKLAEDDSLSSALHEKIKNETTLSRILDTKRSGRNSLDFDRPDLRAVFDEKTGKLVRIDKEYETESHRLVENFALQTNEYHAKLVNLFNEQSKTQNGNELDDDNDEQVFTIPYVHRFHDEPNPDKIAQAKLKLEALGICSDILPDEITPEFVSRLTAQTNDTNVKDFMLVLTLRALQRASYESSKTGHFGLDLDNYAQVTSPIRRIGDTFNQVIDIILINMKIKTKTGYMTFADACDFMEKTKNKTAEDILSKRASVREKVKSYIKAEFEKQFGIADVYEFAKTLAREATRTEQNSEKAEKEMLSRWCAFTLEDYVGQKTTNGKDKYYNARLTSIDNDKVEVEILDAPFCNFTGMLQTGGYSYKFDLKDKTKNVLKVKIVTADKFNNIITFEEDEIMRKKRGFNYESGHSFMEPATPVKQGKAKGKNKKYFGN